MECLGVVETFSGEGRFVVKASYTPETDDPIFDSKGNRIGTVKRIFGPVDGPYVTVSCTDGKVQNDIVGKKVFFKGEAKHGKGKRRN
ncbi:MAG: hypothetical protein IJT54_03420 [Candidatus Methanomethylophilaceae archaeon]|nr:hypothetical protein [Candidatus Methanomethylophilaceae archaeon]